MVCLVTIRKEEDLKTLQYKKIKSFPRGTRDNQKSVLFIKKKVNVVVLGCYLEYIVSIPGSFAVNKWWSGCEREKVRLTFIPKSDQ